MPRYSDELIEEVRSRNDIVDVISQYVRLSKKGSTYFGLCPFHNEKTGSFSVSPNKQMYYCFGCHAGGNVFTFLMQYENYTFGEAMEALAERAGVDLPKQEYTAAQRQEADRRARLLEINKEAAKYFFVLLRGERGKRALDYFKKRALSDETIHKFGLGYSDQYSDDLYRYLRSKGYDDEILKDSGLVTIDEVRGGHDKFWNRAMFPIMDVHNKVIGFGGRVMGDGEPKYLNSPETKIFDKSRNLYGLNFARATKKPQLLLCEGYMDVIALHQAGFDNAVASLGTALTSGHANLLKRYTKEVYLTYDSMVQSQKLLLTWLTNSPALFPKVQRYVGADDFTDPICHSVAKMLFEQYEKDGTVNPARIISTYEDEEQQREAAGILNATIHRVDTREEREKALRETVIRVRENSINHKLANTFDVQEMAALAKEKNELPGTVHIPLEE